MKLEAKMNLNSTVCACCPKFLKMEIWKADLSADSDSSEPQLKSKPVPDVCPNCKKPVEKDKIILQLCDQTTKERFPDEWKY